LEVWEASWRLGFRAFLGLALSPAATNSRAGLFTLILLQIRGCGSSHDVRLVSAGRGRLPAYLCGWDCSGNSSDRRDDPPRAGLQLRAASSMNPGTQLFFRSCILVATEVIPFVQTNNVLIGLASLSVSWMHIFIFVHQ
jgi:hypothetical protein